MKKFLSLFFISLTLLLLFSYPAPARADLCDESQVMDPETGIFVSNGIVPCGRNVDANGVPTCRCELGHLFLMALRIYNFIVVNIAAPLAAILVVAGGIMFIFAGGKPDLVGKAKQLIWGAVIGILLILGSWVIVDVILKAIGYNEPWSSLNF